ncbi:MAG: heavy metal translocating P-type ATPase [Acidobacteria bacterium]|nr:heavy metal translocating P-type ATPase [Acidobacteriota bacterium]
MAEETNDKLCDLCGLTVNRYPFARSFEGEEKSFCCLGCMNVYAILLESGVIASGQDVRETEVFKRSMALGLIATRDQNGKDALPPIPADAQTQEVLLQVSGMWCSSCAWLIEHTLKKERGVVSAEAFFASDLVKVKYCPQYLPPDRISERIAGLGYKTSECSGDNEIVNAERRDLLLRLGIAGFLYLNIMTLSMALYVGYFEQIAESVRRFLPFVLMALATPIIFYSAMPILKPAWLGLRNRVIRMETLLGLGILTAYVYSAVQAFLGGHVYFDTASAIVTLVLVGKVIERNAKEQTSRAITLLYRMMPKKVRLVARTAAGIEEKFVSVDALNVGDVFAVKAGERIPADGEVIAGSSHADESLLTGESVPVEKEPGSRVIAGSLNSGGVLEVRASKVGEDTTLMQIIKLVEQALGSKSSLERTVDRISRLFVPGVIAIAALTFLVCWLGGFTPLGEALMRAITILVIACPCALGMATPLALTAAIGSASRRGILVSDSRVLETIRKVDTIVFDKTGTITEGDFALLEFEPIQTGSETESLAEMAQEEFSLLFSTTVRLGDEHRVVPPAFDAEESLRLVASLERYSEHPLSRAVLKRAEEERIELLEARDVEIRKGLGVTGSVAGHRVFVGNRHLAEEEGVWINFSMEVRAESLEAKGLTVAFFGWDGQLKGLMALGDQVRPEAELVIADFRRRGVKTMIVSGDAQATTARVASLVGADDFLAEALPVNKTAVIEQLQQQGQFVAMIGDGINDAPALAVANLGIAVGSGADVAMKAAAVVLMTNSLGKLSEVFELANKTWRIVRQNLFWAFFYNSLGISLAVAGILNPIMAAGAMLLSSLSVIGNSLRLGRQ